MQIKIGSTLYIGGSSKYQLSPNIQGLECPAIRVGDGLYAGKDGGYVSGHFYGHRTIIIPGFYIGSDCDEADGLRKLLFGFMRIRYRLPICIRDFSDNYYFTEGYVTSVKASITNPVSGDFQLTLLCPDPNLYYIDNFSAVTPKYFETNLRSTTTISNEGNVDAYPIITITGIVHDVTIENTTTLQTMEIEITTTNATDVLMINMDKRVITLNGDVINANRSTDSSWWYLLPENNEIALTFGNGSSATAKLKYKKGYVGI